MRNLKKRMENNGFENKQPSTRFRTNNDGSGFGLTEGRLKKHAAVIPAQAVIHLCILKPLLLMYFFNFAWIPACAGMTVVGCGLA